MVRVISVHHFAHQQVLVVEQPTASTVAPPNRLLLALSSHSVEVRDLQLDGDVLFSFPTVDEVAQICHCTNGDYIATLESKFNRQNRELNFVRVYLNWDSVATLQQSKMNHSGASLGSSECGMVQPMRARIAGRVTPTTNQSELGNLEMIEIPVKRNPHLIAVCQISGNLLIASEKIITIYGFTIKTHDISKLKFIDFEEMPIYIEVAFRPKQCELAENYIAALSSDAMHLFKIIAGGNPNSKGGANHPNEEDVNENFKFVEEETIDYRKLMEDPVQAAGITINLPTILRENSAVHRHSPFTHSDKDLTATLRSTSPLHQISGNYTIENLIQLKLKPIVIDSTHNQQRSVNEEFKTMILKPLYIDEAVNRRKRTSETRFLQSAFLHNLHSISCLVATQQEGYMYQFVDQHTTQPMDHCVTVYPFTAPVYKIVLEDYFLHALTETGLESYTLRLTHRLCQSLQEFGSTCPPIDESICLVGLRPFIGIEQLLLSNNHLVLLANAEASSPTHSCNSSTGSSTATNWTLYALELPTPKTIFNDIAIVANAHRLTSSATYCHLMSEAHMILRATLMLYRWTCDESSVKHAKALRHDPAIIDAIDVYKQSCALLADHYIMCREEKDYQLAAGYYKLASVQVYDVIRRVKKLQEQANNKAMQGLISYLKSMLLGGGNDTGGNRAKLSEAVLNLFEKHNYEELPALVLRVPLLREYGIDNLIGILTNSTIPISNERRLALVVLYILKGNVQSAEDLLKDTSEVGLVALLEEHWELLFEQVGPKGGSSFSELSTLLTTQRNGDLLAALFAGLIERKTLQLGKVLKIFLDYLPSSTEASQYGQVLQTMLELHLKNYFGKHDRDAAQFVYDRSTHEAIKLLVRSYLSQLQYFTQVEDKEKDKQKDMYLFMNRRHEYLNRMPPFATFVSPDGETRTKAVKNERADLLLKKLQALLCSKVVPNQVLLEMNNFLEVNDGLRGRLSLQICIVSVTDAIGMLANECPQALLQYARDVFSKPDEWKLLISSVQQKVLTLSHMEEHRKGCGYYKKLLKDILSHVATTMNLENLINVFPQHMDYSTSYILTADDDLRGRQEELQNNSDDDVDILNEIQNYDPYITLCKETMHANQIKKLITATGQQLLCTLNL